MRRPTEERVADAIEAVRDVLDRAHIEHFPEEATGPNDVRLPILVDDRSFVADIVVVAYCTAARARQLLAETEPRAGIVPMVVADRITEDARALLSDANWSWFDRRGRLHLRAPGIRVEADLPPATPTGVKSARRPISGRGGLAVAYWLCAHPDERISPTGHAPDLGLAPSTISVAARQLADAGLVDLGAGVFPELFWELAAAWRLERTWLASAPEPVGRSADPREATWRRSGSAAAAALGAPVVTASGGPLELLVPGPAEVTIAVRRFGSAEPGAGSAVVAVAPVRAAVFPDPNVPETIVGGWPAAPTLAVALDVAQDQARGREILEGWRVPRAVW